MKNHLTTLAVAALTLGVLPTCLSSLAHADEKGGLFSNVGPNAGIYIPFSSKTKNTFGSSFKGIGVGFGSVRPKAGGQLRPDFSLLSESENGDRALLGIAGLQYRKTFDSNVEDNAQFVPYYGAGANLIYGRLKVGGETDSNFGAGASVFVGTSIGRHAFVEARVRALSSVAEYNFSGLSLSAGLRF